MRFLEKNEESCLTNPVLDFWVRVDGALVDPFASRWKIEDATSGTPVEIVGWTAGSIDFGTGHRVIPWTVPGGSNTGLFSAVVELTIADGDTPFEFRIPFDVIQAGLKLNLGGGPAYALLSDLRTEGVPTSITDQRALRSLVMASQQIEAFTDRQFGAIAKTIKVDGRGSADLLIDEPICALSLLQILTHAFGSEATIDDQDLTDVEIYNRHLRGLSEPDDRDNPKLSFRRLHDHLGVSYRETRPLFPHHVFPHGQQNVVLEGAFGYTEPDGSPVGGVPFMIRRACAMLTSILAAPAVAAVGAVSASRGPIVEEKTRDQTVKYAKPSSLGGAQPGPFTGDAAIDNLLLPFVKPVRIGAA